MAVPTSFLLCLVTDGGVHASARALRLRCCRLLSAGKPLRGCTSDTPTSHTRDGALPPLSPHTVAVASPGMPLAHAGRCLQAPTPDPLPTIDACPAALWRDPPAALGPSLLLPQACARARNPPAGSFTHRATPAARPVLSGSSRREACDTGAASLYHGARVRICAGPGVCVGAAYASANAREHTPAAAAPLFLAPHASPAIETTIRGVNQPPALGQRLQPWCRQPRRDQSPGVPPPRGDP